MAVLFGQLLHIFAAYWGVIMNHDNDCRLPLVAKVAEVAIFLRSSEPTVRELIRTHKLHAVRCGRSIRVSRDSVEQFLAGERP